jgi:hypothetical protein
MELYHLLPLKHHAQDQLQCMVVDEAVAVVDQANLNKASQIAETVNRCGIQVTTNQLE